MVNPPFCPVAQQGSLIGQDETQKDGAGGSIEWDDERIGDRAGHVGPIRSQSFGGRVGLSLKTPVGWICWPGEMKAIGDQLQGDGGRDDRYRDVTAGFDLSPLPPPAPNINTPRAQP